LKKSIIVFAVVLIVAGVSGYLYFRGREYEIVLTNQQLQDQLDKRFPITKKHLRLFSVTYKDPQVILQDGSDKVTLSITAVLNGISVKVGERPAWKPDNLSSTCRLVTTLRYEPSQFAFYLDDSTVEELRFEGIPKKFHSMMKKISLVAIQEILRKYPVYTLRGDTVKKKVSKMLLKDVVVRDGKLHITLSL